ncbi:MAG: glycosyltransferase [Magnetococcales bacterium]|nr:glycosyltransferase [Magnetococcales bacterium]
MSHSPDMVQHADPHLICVIPCRNEPDPVMTLESLCRCDPPDIPVEVIMVINGSDNDTAQVREANQHSLHTVTSWVEKHTHCFFTVRTRFHPDLPHRQAGVGLARRLGMDEACNRLLSANETTPGIIVALDADCQVAPNYWTALVDHFRQNPKIVGASLSFQHPLDDLTFNHRQGIIHYELFLRLYRQGLRYAGSPHAYHTVGSAMAVRADAYRRVGGMNQRKAGEDFYFLQKVMAHGMFSDLTTTTVFPSARMSLRVPFGTGRAMTQWHQEQPQHFLTYDPKVYADLRHFFQAVGKTSRIRDGHIPDASPCLEAFLAKQRFNGALAEIAANTASAESFMKRFFLWFNPFKILKFVHFASDAWYPRVPVGQAARTLLQWMGTPVDQPLDGDETLLHVFQRLDRNSG